jgi:hypothetical protein
MLTTSDMTTRASCSKVMGAVALRNPSGLADFPQDALDGVCMCVRVYTYLNTCINAWMHAYINVYIYIYIYIYTHTHTNTHIHTHTGIKKAVTEIPDPVTKVASMSALAQIAGGDMANGYADCVRVCMYVSMCVCVCIHVSMANGYAGCMCTCVCVCMCVCMNMCM